MDRDLAEVVLSTWTSASLSNCRNDTETILEISKRVAKKTQAILHFNNTSLGNSTPLIENFFDKECVCVQINQTE